MMDDKQQVITDLLKAGEDYLFILADVISGRTVQYPDRMDIVRNRLLATVEAMRKATENK